ncbi:hypothetical protein [Vallitalea guaymasensis]|uniref:hypothetical protein n=1 Tax=Vallitalea guaymasensis TaxID=1185412 RepID=UPI002F3FE332
MKDNNEKVTVRKDTDGLDKIKRWMSEDRLLTIHSNEPNLEEIFLSLTGREL